MATIPPKYSAHLRPDRAALAGASIVVTRPAATATTLKRRIRACGGQVVNLPAMVLHASADSKATKAALAAAHSADVVVFVSPAAVRFAYALRPTLRFARTCLVCAVGAGTARALTRNKVAKVVWPRQRQDSEGLLALLPLERLRGKRVVLIGAPGGRDLLVTALRSRRAHVEHLHVYHRDPPQFSARQLAALERAGAPMVTLLSSTEALVNLRQVLPLQVFARLAAGELVVSSERLAGVARASLFAHVHVAASPAPVDLLNAACTALARHRL